MIPTKLTPKVLFELYCLGDRKKHIQPFRKLTPFDFEGRDAKISRNQKKRLSDMLSLMAPVKASLKEQAEWIKNPTIEQVHAMWEKGAAAIDPRGRTAPSVN